MTTNEFYAHRPNSIQLRAGSQVSTGYDEAQMHEFNLREGEFKHNTHNGRTEDVVQAMQRYRILRRE
jgi:hypothetical protein